MNFSNLSPSILFKDLRNVGYKAAVANLLATYERLGNLAEAAFDPNLNLEVRLQASIELAEAYGVSDSKIIHNVDELDSFMLS